MQHPTAQARPSGAFGVQGNATTPSSGRTIYATFGFSCTTSPGTGSQASPYCLMQDAVDAAQPGDTIDVLSGQGYSSRESVTVKTSGISIVGVGDQAWISQSSVDAIPKPALILDHVSNVTVSNMRLTSYGGSAAVEVIGSTGVTIDSGFVSADNNLAGFDALTIDGASSNVAVSRTYVDAGFSPTAVRGIAVGSGARNVTLAGDILADTGITATAVSGLNVTGNTIQRGCGSAIDIEGASSGVHVENNLLEDSNPNTDYTGVYQSNCAAWHQSWAPDVTVSAGSSAATTADYNDFYVYGTDATAPYSWAGTTYPTLAGFQAGAAQGAHDTNDSKQAKPVGGVDTRLQAGSAAIGSADLAAPGMLSSDFYGTTPYTSRGAVQFDANPTFAVALKAEITSAYGLYLHLNVTSDHEQLSTVVTWGDGSSVSLQGYNENLVVPPHTYAKLGTYTITATVTDASGHTLTNNVTITTAGSEYTAYGPTRLLDTRDGGVPVQPQAAVPLRIAGNGGIPVGVTAVVLNVTVTDAARPGYITAYPDGTARPSTSNVNFTAGQTVPNLVIVPVGRDGNVDLFNGSWGTVDLVADVTGYFTPSMASGYTAVGPVRLVDTRYGTGVAQGQVAGRGSFPVQIAGNNGLPNAGIAAVALNVTVTGAQGAGYLTAYPDGQQPPLASNVNFGPGQTIANSVIVPVGSDGRVGIFNGSYRPTDVVVDVVGYYSADSKSAYVPIAPTRLLDTRSPATGSARPLPNGDYIYMPFGNGPDVTGFVLNATVTDTQGAGYLTVSPDPNYLAQYNEGSARWPDRPLVSSLNWVPGETVPNLVQATPGPYGIMDFWNSGSGSIDLVVDAFGFYQND